jgi:hypothetical protein
MIVAMMTMTRVAQGARVRISLLFSERMLGGTVPMVHLDMRP